ncbi:MAG: hypothetical protein CMH50_01850, partial [Myxococcales bacterium]|nr:hypothetical protein [Myxococcales bacterium]
VSGCILATCGDGFPQTGQEECDDGNPTDGDGCDSNCTATSCGNGVITEGEECDDGNLNNLDGCTNDCQWLARDCGSHLRRGELENGVYEIDPDAGGDDEPYSVYCEQETNGGGWTRAIVVTKDELLWNAWTTRRPGGVEGERAGPLQDFSDHPDGLDLEYMFRVDGGVFYERTFRSVHRSAWDPDFGGSFAPDGFEFAASFGGPWTRCSHELNHHNGSYNWVISHYPEGNVPLCASQINGYSFTITGDNNRARNLNGLGDPMDGVRGNGRDANWSRVEIFIRRPPVCGDGIQQSDETCDDGNVNDDDDCPADCRVARSCADLADSPSGLYEFPGTLRGGQPAELYCDNDEDDGGWSLVAVARFGQHGGDWTSDAEINPQHVGSLTEHWHLGADLINLLAVNGEYRVNCFESANNYTRYWHGVDRFRWSTLTRLDYSWAGYGQTGERFVADQSGGQWYGLASGGGETSVVILSHAGGHWACGGMNGPGGEGYTGRGGQSSYRLWVR